MPAAWRALLRIDRYARIVVAALLAIVIASAAPLQGAPSIDNPPLPRPRPASAPARPAPPPPAAHEVRPEKEKPEIDQACLDRLGAAGIEFEHVVMPAAAKPGCGIDTPVRLKSIKLAAWPKTSIRLPDGPILACRFGERFGHWVSRLVAPLIAGELSTELRAVRTGPGYECRNRNRVEAGKISAHATGIAIDVSSFELASGKVLAVKPDGDERLRAAFDSIRVAACGWFLTVLGPGSDAAHSDHMHLDIQPHGSSDRYRICQ